MGGGGGGGGSVSTVLVKRAMSNDVHLLLLYMYHLMPCNCYSTVSITYWLGWETPFFLAICFYFIFCFVVRYSQCPAIKENCIK